MTLDQMPLSKQKIKGKHGSSRIRQLNPEFATAHGLAGITGERSNQEAFNEAILNARNTGKLHLSNLGLRSPLPSECFDLRGDGTVELSLNNNSDKKPWEWFTAESLTSVDLSDNDFGMFESLDEKGDKKVPIGHLDERVERYQSLKILRAKRCHISVLPMDSIYSLQLLAVLDLSDNQISHAVPLELFPPTLTEINLSCNQIPKLYAVNDDDNECLVRVLPFCKTLNVSNNLLTALFPTARKFEGLTHLQTLNCEGNKLSGPLLSSEIIINLCSLHTLDASKNMISVAPDLSCLDKLKLGEACVSYP